MASKALSTKKNTALSVPSTNTVLTTDLKKTFGDDILMSGNAIKEKETIVIPLSPSLDMILNGGVPEGSFVVLTGQPKCGKTTTSLQIAALAQQKQYAYGDFEKGREVYFLNIEGRIKKRDLSGIKGLDLDRFHIIGLSLIHI